MSERINGLVAIIIPVINEQEALPHVLRELRDVHGGPVFVVDGGSSDGTVAVAESLGATVLIEQRRGYGRACVTGATTAIKAGADILVFLDGDGSDDAAALPDLIRPIQDGQADLVIGARYARLRTPGSMLRHQAAGNSLVAAMIRRKYGVPVTDVGPFRAMRSAVFPQLHLREMTYGWPVEMIVRGAQQGLRIREVGVPYRCRIGGTSKVSGTLRGTIGAAYRMLGAVLGESDQ